MPNFLGKAVERRLDYIHAAAMCLLSLRVIPARRRRAGFLPPLIDSDGSVPWVDGIAVDI